MDSNLFTSLTDLYHPLKDITENPFLPVLAFTASNRLNPAAVSQSMSYLNYYNPVAAALRLNNFPYYNPTVFRASPFNSLRFYNPVLSAQPWNPYPINTPALALNSFPTLNPYYTPQWLGRQTILKSLLSTAPFLP